MGHISMWDLYITFNNIGQYFENNTHGDFMYGIHRLQIILAINTRNKISSTTINKSKEICYNYTIKLHLTATSLLRPLLSDLIIKTTSLSGPFFDPKAGPITVYTCQEVTH